MPIKKREEKGQSVNIDEDNVYAADGNGNGDTKIAPPEDASKEVRQRQTAH